MKILQQTDFDFSPELWEVIVSLEASAAGVAMLNTSENSPYHREENVWTHTEMVIDHYIKNFSSFRPLTHNIIAVCSLLFHDAGKPKAEETVKTSDGQTYRRYPGHELLSAVIFTEHWLKSERLRSLLSAEDARRVRWIIEHHLPYGIKDEAKLSALKRATLSTLHHCDIFFDCLRSDAAGRTSDNHQEKLERVKNWISTFSNIQEDALNTFDEAEGTCYILIGPSGAGKSTYFRENLQNTVYHSLDVLRLSFYMNKHGHSSDDVKRLYADAWNFCNEHKTKFDKYIAEDLRTLMQDADRKKFGITIDNVNASKKARARYVQLARQNRMKVVAVEFWCDIETLMVRQETRPDKSVGYDAVARQYYSQTCARAGSEVDEIVLQTC